MGYSRGEIEIDEEDAAKQSSDTVMKTVVTEAFVRGQCPVVKPSTHLPELLSALRGAPPPTGRLTVNPVRLFVCIRPPFEGLETGELLLPVAQHVRLDPAQSAHLADGEVPFPRYRGQSGATYGRFRHDRPLSAP